MQAAGKMLTQEPEEPWATVCADFVGPLPRSKHWIQVLLVMIDRFSKWTQLVPLRSATAESLKKAFRERIIARYGVPKVVITDNGVQFARLKVSWLKWVSVNNSPHHTHHKRIRPNVQTEQSRP